MNLEFYNWYKDVVDKADGQYVKVACPFLIDDKCSDYANRPSCCRHYPQNNGYCSDEDCLIVGLENNTEETTKLCLKCQAKCCKTIQVPTDVEVTKEFIKKWLDIDCTTCQEFFGEILDKRKHTDLD
jgi:Fe-S-cluster containining protein